MSGLWSMVYTATLGATITHTERNTEFTNVITNQYPAVFDDHSSTLAEMRTETDPYPGGVASQATNLGGEIERLRYKLGQIDDSLAAMLGVSANTYYYEDSPSGTISTSLTILNKTADYLITAANCNGLTEINNAGDNGVIVFTMPDATVGLAIKIKCSYQAAGVYNTITINPDTGDTFTVGATTGLTALTTSVVGSVWELTCEVAGVWIAKFTGFRGALVSLGSNKTLTSGATTIAAWDNTAATYDTDGCWSSGDNTKLVIPAGVTKVKLKAYLPMNGAGANFDALIIKNNASDASFIGSSGWFCQQTGYWYVTLSTAVINVIAGDYFRVAIYATATATLNASTPVFLTHTHKASFAMEIIE